jgi:putative salt-induced outer membrane protein YdiY
MISLMVRASVLILLLAGPVFARKAIDVLVMKNGDRLTCEVKRLDAGVLYISLDYVDGTILVDWSKVARLESSQLFLVHTQDGLVYTGSLATTEAPAGRPVQIQVIGTSKESVALDAPRIVKLGETSASFWRRVSGDLSLGINYSRGNSATQYNLGSQIRYQQERWATWALYNSNLSSNSGSDTSVRNQLELNGYRLVRWDNYFIAGLGGVLQSSVQGIKVQTTLGTGFGRFLKNTNRASIALIGGLAWQRTEYEQDTDLNRTQDEAAALIAADVKVFKFKKANLNIDVRLLPALSDPGRVRFNTNASYYLKLFRDLNWNFSFYGSWDNRPPVHFSGSDYGSSSGISWTFGK